MFQQDSVQKRVTNLLIRPHGRTIEQRNKGRKLSKLLAPNLCFLAEPRVHETFKELLLERRDAVFVEADLVNLRGSPGWNVSSTLHHINQNKKGRCELGS